MRCVAQMCIESIKGRPLARMSRSVRTVASMLVAVILLSSPALSAEHAPIVPVNLDPAPRPESAEERDTRLERVRQRRSRLAVVCHRGAHEFAPENTLEDFRAAVQLGADGSEVDIRTPHLVRDNTTDAFLSLPGTRLPDERDTVIRLDLNA